MKATLQWNYCSGIIKGESILKGKLNYEALNTLRDTIQYEYIGVFLTHFFSILIFFRILSRFWSLSLFKKTKKEMNKGRSITPSLFIFAFFIFILIYSVKKANSYYRTSKIEIGAYNWLPLPYTLMFIHCQILLCKLFLFPQK